MMKSMKMMKMISEGAYNDEDGDSGNGEGADIGWSWLSWWCRWGHDDGDIDAGAVYVDSGV